MTNYYIKISDHIPLEDDESLWFKVNASNSIDDTDEILVLRRNEFEELKAVWESAKNNLAESDTMRDIINDAISHINLVVPLSTNSHFLVSSEDSSLKWDYDTVSNIRSSVNGLENSKLDRVEYVVDSVVGNSVNPVQNQAVKTALDKKADEATTTDNFNSLKSTFSTKADKNHAHTGWTYKKLNDYSSIYYNDSIRLCDFRYYRKEYNFTKTDSFTLHTGLIPSAYRPKFDIILPFYHYHLIGYIGDNGNFQIKTDNKAKYAINTRAVWHY